MANLLKVLKKHRFGILAVFLVLLALENALLIRENRNYRAELAEAHDHAISLTETKSLDRQLVGTQAPPFSLGTVDDTQQSLEDFEGRRLVLIFFNTDCPACRESAFTWSLAAMIPGWEEADVVGISPDTFEELRDFGEEHALDFSICLDSDRAVFRQYNVTYVPQAFWIDEQGIIREVGSVS